MIKIYENGNQQIEENRAFLEQNKYLAAFFFLDAPMIDEVSNKRFALKAERDGKVLLAMKHEVFNLLLYGDPEPLDELLSFLEREHYEFDGVLCGTPIGERLLSLDPSFGKLVGMDFMEATEKTEPSCPDIEIPTEEDLPELYEDAIRFFEDCGLPDRPNKERMRGRLPSYRILRVNGRIASFAAMSAQSDDAFRISMVYTARDLRGHGYARKVVNTLKNEILDMGKIATLHVDQANPISNHLYTSLGFRKVVSEGIYQKSKK